MLEGKNYFLPLKDLDIENIRKGKTIARIFSRDTLDPLPQFVVIIGKKKVEKKEIQHIIESGDSVTSIVVDNKQLDKIQNTNQSIRADYGDFNVFLLSENTKEQLEVTNGLPPTDESVGIRPMTL